MIRDVAAQNIALDAQLGAGRAATIPAVFELALFNGDPNGPEAIELGLDEGYDVRATVNNDATTWPVAAANGEKTSIAVTVGGTGTFTLGATHWCLIDAADGVTGWFTGEMTETVTEPTDTIELTVFYGDED